MAVVEEHPYIDENHTRFYSDEGKMLIQVETGKEYEEAVDLYPSKYTYIEKQEEELVEEGTEDDRARGGD